VYGPYLENGNYLLAKLVEAKIFPDSVKCRHVLVGTDEEKGGFPDSIASNKIDSIKKAIEGGASWAAMVDKYNPLSDGSRQKKGEMTFASSEIQSGMQSGQFAKEFGQFILFDGKPGERKVVKTSFGWHYIEVLSWIKPSLQYKVAYLTQKIIASQQTEDNAVQEATSFAGNARDRKSFDTSFEKTLKPKGINKGIGLDIKRTDGSVKGLGFSRQLVKDIYSAKLGEVLKPIQVGNDWVVAVVTETISEGTQSVAKVRPGIEPMLRTKKKAEQLKQRIGKVTTLDAATSVLGNQQQVIDSLRMSVGAPRANFPYDPKAYGAIFNPANKGKIVPEVIIGDQGIYVIQVDNVTATPSESSNVADMRKQQAGQTSNDPIGPLKKAASIKDKRASTTF
jgi:peptidyl-prolyl cis-trans isomerase D